VKLSKLEWATLIITFLALLAMSSYFILVNLSAKPIVITTEHKASAASPAPAKTSSSPDPSQAPFPININTADAGVLTLLPGIGEVRAAAIVAHREKNGPFFYLDQLLEVDGIGEKTLAGIADYITFH